VQKLKKKYRCIPYQGDGQEAEEQQRQIGDVRACQPNEHVSSAHHGQQGLLVCLKLKCGHLGRVHAREGGFRAGWIAEWIVVWLLFALVALINHFDRRLVA
jgi:hypothetical protein